MKFEEALKAMRDGKKVKRKKFKGCYFIKDNTLYFFDDEYSINKADGITEEAIFSDEWELATDSLDTRRDNISTENVDIKITFIGGGEIVIPDEQWDDYHYDGKFFTIIKGGADIAMYNAKEVFSLVLVRQGESNGT